MVGFSNNNVEHLGYARVSFSYLVQVSNQKMHIYLGA